VVTVVGLALFESLEARPWRGLVSASIPFLEKRRESFSTDTCYTFAFATLSNLPQSSGLYGLGPLGLAWTVFNLIQPSIIGMIA